MATDVPTTVSDALEQIQDYLDQLSLDADAAAQRLESFSLQNPPFVEFENRSTFSPGEATKVSKEFIPDLVRAEMNLDLSTFDPDKFAGHTYISEFFDFLEPHLQASIEDGGTGISDDVQTAIFDNHRRRKEQVRDDELSAATANVGKMGFPLPTDMVQAARAAVFVRYADQDYNTSLEITTLIAERAQQNVQHAIGAGIRMESVQSEFTRFFHQAYTEYAKQILEKFRTEQEANIAQFKGDVEITTLQLRADEINSSLSQTDIQQKVAERKFEVDHSIEKTKALMAQSEALYRLQLQATESLTDYYRTVVAGVASQINNITMASDTASS